MRELDSIAIVGAGRLGTALAAALRAAGHSVAGPLGREPDVSGATWCSCASRTARSPRAAAAVPRRTARRPLLGRDDARAARRPRGVLAAPADDRARRLAARACSRGAAAAVDGSTPRALAVADGARASGSGCAPMRVAPEDRAAYHAAASIASNFLVTLEAAAERLAATAGVDRARARPARPRRGRDLGRRSAPSAR